MNRLFACATLAAGLLLPVASQARDHDRYYDDPNDHYYRGDDRGYSRNDRDDRGYYERDRRYHDHWDHNPVRVIGHVVALPFEVGAAVIGATVNVLTAPFREPYYAPPPPPPQAYYYEAPPPRVYYEPAPPPPPRYYYRPY